MNPQSSIMRSTLFSLFIFLFATPSLFANHKKDKIVLLKNGATAPLSIVIKAMNALYNHRGYSVGSADAPQELEAVVAHLHGSKLPNKLTQSSPLHHLLSRKNRVHPDYQDTLASALKILDENPQIILVRSPLAGKYFPRPFHTSHRIVLLNWPHALETDYNWEKNEVWASALTNYYQHAIQAQIKTGDETEIDTTRYSNKMMTDLLGFEQVHAMLESYHQSGLNWHDWVRSRDPFKYKHLRSLNTDSISRKHSDRSKKAHDRDIAMLTRYKQSGLSWYEFTTSEGGAADKKTRDLEQNWIDLICKRHGIEG